MIGWPLGTTYGSPPGRTCSDIDASAAAGSESTQITIVSSSLNKDRGASPDRVRNFHALSTRTLRFAWRDRIADRCKPPVPGPHPRTARPPNREFAAGHGPALDAVTHRTSAVTCRMSGRYCPCRGLECPARLFSEQSAETSIACSAQARAECYCRARWREPRRAPSDAVAG
jgi:hypothetical protein